MNDNVDPEDPPGQQHDNCQDDNYRHHEQYYEPNCKAVQYSYNFSYGRTRTIYGIIILTISLAFSFSVHGLALEVETRVAINYFLADKVRAFNGFLFINIYKTD